MRLSESDLERALARLPNWSVRDGKLHREFEFPNFAHAFSFMTFASYGIEAMNHHPEWSNVYGRVAVDLVTHSAGGITDRDLKLALHLEDAARRFI